MNEKKELINDKVKWAISAVITIILIIPLLIITEPNWLNWNTACLWLLGSLYTFISIHLGVVTFTIPKLFMRKDYKLVLILAGVISIILLFIIPIRFQEIVDANRLEKRMFENNIIQIEALGEKNDLSSGDEIWIEGIRIGEKDYNLYEIQLTSGWEFREDRIMTQGGSSERLVLELTQNSPYELIFRKNPNSGKVKVTIGEYSHTYDLYDSEMIQRNNIDLKELFISNPVREYSIQRIIFYVVYEMFLYLISLVGIIVLKKDSFRLK